jgi:outer membrane cobalamin receptor
VEAPSTLLEKLPTFQDIEDIDLTMLLKVTAGEDGTRTADDEPGHVTVVSEEDIRRTGARTVMEVLRTLPGLEVLTDGLGRARIFVRGIPGGTAAGSSENVLVTLNGLRLNEGVFGGTTAVNLDLPVDNIKRIEVVRGPGSVVNGPGAVLAAINIVTESFDTFRRDELSVGGGNFKSFLYNYRYGTTFHEVSLAGFMQYSYTGGPELDVPVDAQTSRDAALLPLGIRPVSLAPGQTDDDRKSLDANLSMAYRKFVFHARLKKENSGAYVGLLDTLGRQNRLATTQGNLSLEYKRALRLGDLRARVLYTTSKLTELFDVYPPGFTLLQGTTRVFFPSGVLFQEDLNSRRVGADAVVDRVVGRDHTLTVGGLLERESTFGLEALTNFDFERQVPLPTFGPVPSLVPEASRTTASLYAQDAWNPTPRLGLTGGLRVDHYSDVGGSVQPRLAAVYRLPRNFTFKMGYGRGVRAPSFLELFYSSPAYRANGDLDRMRSDSFDATVLLRRKDLRLSLTGYRTWLRDAIVPNFDGLRPLGTPPPTFFNTEGVDARGLDVEASRTFAGNRSLALVYSLQHAEDASSGRRLTGVPTHLARLSANFPAGKYVILSPSLALRGARPRAAGDPRPELDGYSLFDVVARIHNFHPALELSAVVRDLFGTDYFDPSPLGGLPGDYPRAGRSIFIKAKYRF